MQNLHCGSEGPKGKNQHKKGTKHCCYSIKPFDNLENKSGQNIPHVLHKIAKTRINCL